MSRISESLEGDQMLKHTDIFQSVILRIFITVLVKAENPIVK